MTARLLCSVDTLRSPVIQHPRKSLMLKVGSLPSLSFACTALRLSVIKVSQVLARFGTSCLSPVTVTDVMCMALLLMKSSTTLNHAC